MRSELNYVELSKRVFKDLDSKLCEYMVCVGEDESGIRRMRRKANEARDWMHDKIINARSKDAGPEMLKELETVNHKMCEVFDQADQIAGLVSLKYRLLVCQQQAIAQLQREIQDLKFNSLSSTL